MAKQQRAEVVELLRCAADLVIRGCMWARLDAIDHLGLDPDGAVVRFSYEACNAVGEERTELQLLEAAARVEEGVWPRC